MSFIKRLNEAAYGVFPDIQTSAEESTSWPMVTRHVHLGGLGFGLKSKMGWMHDMLAYFSKDPLFRKFSHDDLTFSMWYAYTENFILPLSHDEVVHGKGSLVGKMPGLEMEKYANLKALYGYMYTHPGKKLLFMGGEFAQWKEWAHEESLEWHALEHRSHLDVQRWVKDLNELYRREPALHELDFDPAGFEWVDFNDVDHSIVSYLRKGRSAKDTVLVVCNFTPVAHPGYRVGVPAGSLWKELLNSDAKEYGGQGLGNLGAAKALAEPLHGRSHSLRLTLPPLGFPRLFSYKTMMLILSALGLLGLVLWQSWQAAPDGQLHLTVLEVGSGEALLIETPQGERILVNGGSSSTRLADALGRRLPVIDRSLELLIVAGVSDEQLEAVPRALESTPARKAVWAGSAAASYSARELNRFLSERQIPVTDQAEPGMKLNLGEGVQLTVLAEGRRGSVLWLEWGRFSALLPVGMDFESMDRLLADRSLGPVTVLLLADGGYAPVNTREWIERWNPRFILLSVAAGDELGRPEEETLEALEGYQLLRTDTNGWIEVSTDGERLWVEVERK